MHLFSWHNPEWCVDTKTISCGPYKMFSKTKIKPGKPFTVVIFTLEDTPKLASALKLGLVLKKKFSGSVNKHHCVRGEGTVSDPTWPALECYIILQCRKQGGGFRVAFGTQPRKLSPGNHSSRSSSAILFCLVPFEASSLSEKSNL